ncbi:alpha/beta hydrolase [Candidatus Saccharibacteria bacterium]|nr:alpha/beta hydrolase [Candidatus Saccharibacteria bacterium]
MKNAIIFHGTDCKPEDFWYSWLEDRLEEKGYKVDLPHYSDINRTPIKEFIPKVLENHTFNSETLLIGHSAGVPLILSILENIDQKISKAVLVAGFCQPLPFADTDVVLQKSYDWKKIKSNAEDFLILNSVNDPWGCDDKQGRKLFDELGGTLIIRNDGHFGSSKDPDYTELPIVEKLLS